ncbi:MAG: PKD domain-containing protein [Solirubrobacterales bacterium]|nr:PKD domain-containing protein [Solirubrobacterales bacterium]
MNERVRRHARLIAASLAVLLAAGVGYVLRSAGPANGQSARAAAHVHAIAPPLAPQRRTTSSVGAASASGRHGHPAPAGRTRTSTGPAGLPTPASSPRGVALALKQTTGLTPAQVTSRPVCPRAATGHASCAARTLVLRSSGAPVRPQVVKHPSLGRVAPARRQGALPASIAAASPPTPGTPAYLQQAYDLTALAQTGGAGDTVAVVDAYDDPTAEQDLATYRSTYQLPACTSANGCFRKVGQDGSSSLPAPDGSWEQEIALDLDAVSAVCPECHILLVEANSSSFSNLQAGMQTAAGLGANQISASWGGTSSSVPSVFRTFSGVATVAANGDSGYAGAGQDSYPAALPGVTAAGGTSLAPAGAPSARGFGESAWSWNGLTGGASGCDLQFQRPVYQPAAGCAGRAYADLSADADPNAGLTVYDNGAWHIVGGTSLATPLIAGYYAITGVAGATPRWAYAAGSSLNDVVSGSSGNCAAGIAYICNAGPGYDGPTGVGSISGSVITGAPGIGGPAIGSSAGNTYTQSVAAHGATIAGGIYRNGLDTTWWIEYGTSTSYGNQTPASDIGAGSAPVAVTGYLSQLTPGTTYHYRLVAKNSLGTTYGYDYTFTTSPAAAGAPTAAFMVPFSTAAPGTPVSFDASRSTPAAGGSISDYSWNFGDGTPAVDRGTAALASHTYAARGSYTVTLKVTSNGQSDTSTQTVTVDTAPTAAFTPTAAAVPAGTTVAFNAGTSAPAAGGSITDYSWNFGDGTPALDGGTGALASHTFTAPGTYNVTLTATDDLDVSTTTTQQVTVAAFTASPAIPSPGSPVTFTAVGGQTSAGPNTQYSWTFGDGTSQLTAGSSVTHTYNNRGAYQVSLTVQNSGAAGSTGNGTSVETSAALNVDSPPSAVFTSASAALPGTSIKFDAGASAAQGSGHIADYSWDFGDGTQPVNAGGTAATSHTFATPGVYTVTLTATDDLGAAATTSRQVTIDQPTAAFTLSTSTLAPNAAVSFDASSSSDSQSTIADYTWDFGDGTGAVDAGRSATVSHSFSAAGAYTVKLTVKDQLGLAATTTQQVVVAPAPSQPTTTPAPPPVSSPPPAPVTSSPPAPPPLTSTQPSPPLAAKLTGLGRQRLGAVLAHGLRVALTVNQPAGGSFQITIRPAHSKGPVVLLRSVRRLGAGGHTVTLKLSRAAAGRLAATGATVLTVRVTLTGADGATLTRTAKITLVG